MCTGEFDDDEDEYEEGDDDDEAVSEGELNDISEAEGATSSNEPATKRQRK